MYQNPVLFPEQTNREDFLKFVSLFDDNTGQPIDVSGRTLAAPGDFTGSTWTVTDGTIVTNSVTQLTIKDYPFGNEMQAVALTVAQNLGILAGDPITIADVNPLNSMTGYVTSYAPVTGALVVQVGANFDFELRAHQHHGDGYGIAFTCFGGGPDGPIIRAQLGNMITEVDIGVLQIRIPASQMIALRHRTYRAAMILFDGYDTRQLFIGKLPILSGGVSTMPFATTPTSNPYDLP